MVDVGHKVVLAGSSTTINGAINFLWVSSLYCDLDRIMTSSFSAYRHMQCFFQCSVNRSAQKCVFGGLRFNQAF